MRIFATLVLLCGLGAWALPETLPLHNLRDGTMRVLNLRDGKMKVFVFLSARCPCSASHEALLADLAREFSGTPFYAVHSNVDEMAEVAREHFQKAPFQFPIFQDEGAKIADEFGALKTPHAFVVSGEGKILFSGGVTNSTRGPAATRQLLKEALVKLGEGKNPDPAEFRTLGCLIARP